MIFRIHIPKDSEQLELAHKIRSLFITSGIKTSTYEPKNASVGIKAHQNISKKLLGQVVGLVHRSGYEIVKATSALTEATHSVSSPQRRQQTMEINTRKQI